MNALARSWARWDRFPEAPAAAKAMEADCTRVASDHGLSTTEFRARLSAARRARYCDATVTELEALIAEVMA